LSSLTLTPALCGIVAEPTRCTEKSTRSRTIDFLFGLVFRLFNRTFDATSELYAGAISRSSWRCRRSCLLLYGGLLVATGVSFTMIADRGSFPIQDQGYVIVAIRLPWGVVISDERGDPTRRAIRQPNRRRLPHSLGVGFVGATFSVSPHAAVTFLPLDECQRAGRRGRAWQQCGRECGGEVAAINEAEIFIIPPPRWRGCRGGRFLKCMSRIKAAPDSKRSTGSPKTWSAGRTQEPGVVQCFTNPVSHQRSQSRPTWIDRKHRCSTFDRNVSKALQVFIWLGLCNDFNCSAERNRVTAASRTRSPGRPSDILK